MNKREVGFKYENVAKEYLILQGLVFVESNFYTKFGEIDLIFFEKSSQTLVFV
ncbi:YraN family protein, partial [Leptotrichia wadei]